MATATYVPSTSDTDLNTLWKKVSVGVVKAFGFGVDEYNALQKLKRKSINWSAREITMELDLNDDINVANIPEGGKEARPASQKPVTATLTWILMNTRFTYSLTAKYIRQRQGSRPMLEDQFKNQARKKVEAMHRKVGDMFWGFSTGTIGHLTADNTGTTSMDVDNLYGITGLGGTTANLRVADLFRALEFYAILQSDGTFREIVQVASGGVDRATNIMTTAANMGTTADGDLVTPAASVENTGIAGTDRNRWIVGVLDMMTSTSVHSVSSATEGRWAAALANTSGGRFNGVKLRKLKQAINNNGGGTLDTVWWAQGVWNDVTALLQAGLRFTDAFNMEMDGDPKSKGVTFRSTKRIPDGHVFGWDSQKSIMKDVLMDLSAPAFEDGYKLQDDSGMIFSIDYPLLFATINRANMGYYDSLTEQ